MKGLNKVKDWYNNLFISRDDHAKVPTWFELALLFVLIVGLAIGAIYIIFFKEYTL